MTTNPPQTETGAHWALYLLAEYESAHPDTPRATVTDLWATTDLAQHAFRDTETLEASLALLADWDIPTADDHTYCYILCEDVSDTSDYTYCLTDLGKRHLRALGTPTESVGDTAIPTPPEQLPEAAFTETGRGEPADSETRPTTPRDLPATTTQPRPPATNDESETRPTPQSEGATSQHPDSHVVDRPARRDESGNRPARTTTGPVDHVFVDPATGAQADTRHAYVYSEAQEAMVRKCHRDTDGHAPDQLAFVEAAAFAETAAACDQCVAGLDIARSSPDRQTEAATLNAGDTADAPALDADADNPALDTIEMPALEAGDAQADVPAISVEPDWEWLAVALAESGHPELAKRARTKELTPDDLYGEVLTILTENHDVVEATSDTSSPTE